MQFWDEKWIPLTVQVDEEGEGRWRLGRWRKVVEGARKVEEGGRKVEEGGGGWQGSPCALS